MSTQDNNYTQADFNNVEEYRAFVENRIAQLKDKSVRRDVMQSILAGGKFPNPNGILNKWMEQACGVKKHFTNEPDSNIDIETMSNAVSTASTIELLAKGLGSFVFGNKNPDEYISPKEDMKVENIQLPETPKSEKVPFFLSPTKFKEITTNPLIPVCRKDDYLVVLGKDSKTNQPVTFLMGIPNDKAYTDEYQDCEMSMYLYVGGIQPKYMGRTSYKPTSKDEDSHAQMHIENGRLTLNKDKEYIDKFDTKVVHYHSYLTDGSGHLGTVITNPLHYTSLIKDGDNDYLPEETATCQTALLSMMSRFNVLAPKLQETPDNLPLPNDLTCGALVSLGAMDETEDFDEIPLTTEFYDILLANYQKFVETGERNFDDRIIPLIWPETTEEDETVETTDSAETSNAQNIIEQIKLQHESAIPDQAPPEA